MLHDINNWRLTDGFFWYRYAPPEAEGYAPAPTITWKKLVTAYRNIRRSRAVDALSASLPGAVRTMDDLPQAMGVLWEICCRWEAGDYDDLEPVCDLICSVHQHLGEHYEAFVAV